MTTSKVPAGFRLGGLHCGVKSDPEIHDLALVVADEPVVAAGVYTQNRVFAAPVAVDRQRTPSDRMRAVIINSGNANACTGQRGLEDAQRMTQVTAEALGADAEQVLVLSTGVIGRFLPMENIEAGIARLTDQLGDDETHLVAAARGMMTTDTVHKLASREILAGESTISLVGLCKGAAMIGPNMATMLSVLLTDAPLSPRTAQQVLADAVDQSFNCLSVEGHMSTNDSVLLLASGAAGGDALQGEALQSFQDAVNSMCVELARAIASDGEGITHLITIQVEGCRSVEDARQIAKTVANSALVKTAIAGADPNWGRIVSAAGYAGVPFDPGGVSLTVQGTLLYEQGVPVAFDEADVSTAIRDNRETHLVLRFIEGETHARYWTTDLTAEYVRLNSDYRT